MALKTKSEWQWMRMCGRRVFSALACLALACTASLAQGQLKASFGEWQHRCEAQAANGAEQCILIQNVQDEADINLAIVILKVEDPLATQEARKKDAKAAPVRRLVLRVIVPLGILLPRGLGLKVDEKEIGTTGFVRCLESGCVAEVDMDDPLVEAFKKGKTALFAIYLTPEEGRGLPVKLTGFDQGLLQLK
jgi:invasion protein IalB